ncbi:MAG: T9SS type A sorting domain-containing protein [bacterium]
MTAQTLLRLPRVIVLLGYPQAENPVEVEFSGQLVLLGGNPGTSPPRLFDRDQDGDLDVASGSYGDSLISLINVNDTFEPQWKFDDQVFAGLKVAQDATPAFWDVNNDGLVDLIVAGTGGWLDFYHNDSAVGIDTELKSVAKTIYLKQNYPNPFNPETSIEYELAESGRVRLTIYNLLGQQVRTLVDEWQRAGRYRVRWDGRGAGGRTQLASGVYVYELRVGEAAVQRKKMVLLQ